MSSSPTPKITFEAESNAVSLIKSGHFRPAWCAPANMESIPYTVDHRATHSRVTARSPVVEDLAHCELVCQRLPSRQLTCQMTPSHTHHVVDCRGCLSRITDPLAPSVWHRSQTDQN